MADKKRLGRQTPTSEFTLLETNSDITAADETIQIYETEKRHAMEWQMYLIRNIMAKDADGLWIHSKVGYSIPRRNGKGEILVMRELWGLLNGEKILHTAHRTTTSHSAAVRLVKELDDRGYIEIQRPDKTKEYEKSYTFSKQFGLERIHIYDGDKGGQIDFRTRSGKGGLGEGFDLLIVDEAQEYQDDHESALKYVVTDSANPQTIMCGTPPTAVSSGTVFTKFRNDCLSGKGNHSYWAEWSVEEEHEFDDREAWYETNPSLDTHINRVSNVTFMNITIAWHNIIASNVAKPKAHAFIIEPKTTMMNKSQIKEPKQICNGLIKGFSSLGL